MTGNVEGQLTSQVVAEALSKQLSTLSTNCKATSNISITPYTTEVPYQSATTCNLEELMGLFRDFSLKAISGGKGIPIEVFFFPFFLL